MSAVRGDRPAVAALVLDTSGPACGVLLAVGERRIRRCETMARGHAERLMPMIAEVLREAACTPAALRAVIVCTGPGSFTGIRVGVAAARGMALGLGIPAVGVDLFAALARAAGGTSTVILPSGREIFAQRFSEGRADAPPAPASGAAVTHDIAALSADGGVLPLLLAEGEARLAEGAPSLPAPVYLRPPDAAVSRRSAPVLLP